MRQTTVLIADDDVNVRTALRIRLKAQGYRVIECWDGIGVLSKCHKEHVDAMVLDYEMPAGDGQSIAHRVRQQCTTPIVFLSGHDVEEFRTTVTQLPDTYYLPKPLGNLKLTPLLESVIGQPSMC